MNFYYIAIKLQIAEIDFCGLKIVNKNGFSFGGKCHNLIR